MPEPVRRTRVVLEARNPRLLNRLLPSRQILSPRIPSPILPIWAKQPGGFNSGADAHSRLPARSGDSPLSQVHLRAGAPRGAGLAGMAAALAGPICLHGF